MSCKFVNFDFETNIFPFFTKDLLTHEEIVDVKEKTDDKGTSSNKEEPEKKVVFNNVTASWTKVGIKPFFKLHCLFNLVLSILVLY